MIDGKATLLKYELKYDNIGIIQKIKDFIIPEECEKDEAPFLIEMFWIIKVIVIIVIYLIYTTDFIKKLYRNL